jgi:uncharacterized protein
MDFDWLNPSFDFKQSFMPKEVEESFEDPFSMRLAPDEVVFQGQARFFSLGKTLDGRGVFSVYRTNGNQARVLAARPFTAEEDHFYERKKQQNL